MQISRIPRIPSVCRLVVFVVAAVLFASACSGGSTSDATESQQAESTASSPVESSSVQDEPAEPAEVVDADSNRFTDLGEVSDATAEASSGDGRLMIGVDCLEGFSTPTATIVVVGENLEFGTHEAAVTPSVSGMDLLVRSEQVQDLPAGSTYYAAQSGFDAPEYVFTYDTLGVTLTVPGCP